MPRRALSGSLVEDAEELPQRLCFDLADTFARHRELLADVFERVVCVHADAKAFGSGGLDVGNHQLTVILARLSTPRIDRHVGCIFFGKSGRNCQGLPRLCLFN